MSAAPAPSSTTAGGFYHCSVKGVGRAKGRSIVAAAAYRSGERLADEITGQMFDYRTRGGIIDTFIMTPDNAPAWAQDRAQLWNEAERGEDRANGRLATEFELALPHELTAAQQKQLVKDFLAPFIDRHGVAVDVAVHQPGEGRDHRNIHAHVLVTHRELGPEGFGEIANTRTMTRKRLGQDVHEKIAGIAATPADIKAIRQDWEQAVNRAYERAGLDIRVDHRSHKDRGIAQEPSTHLGPDASAMERRGFETDRGDVNREITQRNADRQKVTTLEAEERALTAQIIDLAAERERRYGPPQKNPDEPPATTTQQILAPLPEIAKTADAISFGKDRVMPPAANQNSAEPLTLEAIKADPWNAVYLPVPDNAGEQLLTEARNAVVDVLWGGAEKAPHIGEPAVPPTNMGKWASPQENYANGSARLTELDWRLEQVEERHAEFTASADAVTHRPVPEVKGPDELRAEFQTAAEDVTQDRFERSVVPPEKERELLQQASGIGTSAAERDPSDGPQPPSSVRSIGGIADQLFSHLARAVDVALGALFSFFVDEPKLTPAQAHQKAQADGNLETLHAEAHAEAEQVKEAARDEQIYRADQETALPLAAPEYFRAIPRPGRDHEREIERERD